MIFFFRQAHSTSSCIGRQKGKKIELQQVTMLLLLLAIVYGLMPFFLNPMQAFAKPEEYGGFWSPDSGARFAMIRNWIAHGSLTHLVYQSSDSDPTGQLHPLSFFLFHRSNDFTMMYSPVFPLLCGMAYRVVGLIGLTVVPAMCGLGCVATTYMIARRLGLRSRVLLALALGLATPLILYSSVFWDHSALMLMTALMGYWVLKAVQSKSLRDATIAGAVIASGMWLHEQYLALFVAAWLAFLPAFLQHRKLLAGLPLGFAAVVMLWMASNQLLYGTVGGSHLGANVFQNNNDHPFSLTTILNLTEFANRATTQLVGAALLGHHLPSSHLWPYYFIFACLLVAYMFWSWDAKGTITVTVSMVVALAATSLSMFCLISVHTYATPQGLFQATPLLIPALAVPWYTRHRRTNPLNSADIYITWLSRACGLFLLFSLINPMYPGVDWGSRYLLTALPLLTILSAYAVERQYAEVGRSGRVLIVIFATTLVMVSLICQVYGLLWVRRSLAYDMHLSMQLATIHAPILVTDTDFNGRLAAAPTSQTRFLIRTQSDAKFLGKILRHSEFREAAFVGLDRNGSLLDQAIVESGHRFVRSESKVLVSVVPEKEMGNQLWLVHFSIHPTNETAIQQEQSTMSAP